MKLSGLPKPRMGRCQSQNCPALRRTVSCRRAQTFLPTSRRDLSVPALQS